MAKTYRKRLTPEETEEKLLNAVGALLREKGYDALSASAIARLSGVQRNKIAKRFGGKAALVRRYLMGNDFWLPSLQAVTTSQPVKSVQVLRLFIDLLQAQFRYFLSNRELRQVILAQMTAHDHLMQTINTMRETEGNRVILLADEHFRGTGIDINWVIGLILGGGYFYGLQGDTGNGPACGRDIHNERDVAAGLRTMGQLLELVWWAAERIKKDKLQHRYFQLIHSLK